LKAAELSTNKKKRIVIIGGVAAGTSAASKAKRIDPEADVKIIQEESFLWCVWYTLCYRGHNK